MAWFMRGVQSAVFHYASCAPCIGYTDRRKRRKSAKEAKKVREKMQLEQPEAYHHPEPTGTNPFWDEEIAMGPGPPPRRARRTNTGSTRAITTSGTLSSGLSKGESSLDGDSAGDMRLSEDLVDDENWNRKRYQREDEDLWGHDNLPLALQQTASASSVGAYSIRRPGVRRTDSYNSARAPPVNDLHPPVVSNPSADPADNRWMLQPPPKASVMAGKERATYRSRSGSGASSRVELSLQRQLSTKRAQQRLDRGEALSLSTASPMSSHSALVSGAPRDRRAPQARPPSATSSRRRKRVDTVMTKDTLPMTRTDTGSSQHSRSDTASYKGSRSHNTNTNRSNQHRPCLSTVTSVGSNELSQHHSRKSNNIENTPPSPPSPTLQRPSYKTSQSMPYPLKRAQTQLSSSDITSLSVLQDLVSPRALLNSRFVSAPLVEAKIMLPPSEEDVSRTKKHSTKKDERIRVPFDSTGEERDPKMRWSVDF